MTNLAIRYVALLVMLLALCAASVARAHLMVAQHGSLNVLESGAYMVLSLPVSAFAGLDADADGRVSMIEFNQHRAAVVAEIEREVTLEDARGHLPIRGIMLSPVLAHGGDGSILTQLAVLARFPLRQLDTELSFRIGLFGKKNEERALEITANRATTRQQRVFHLSPGEPTLRF